MFHIRVLSAVVGIPVLLLAVWKGGAAHFFLTLALMVIALMELYKIYIMMNLKPSFPAMLAGVLALAASAWAGGAGYLGMALVPVAIMLLLAGSLRFPVTTPADMAAGFTGTFYIGLLIYFYLVRTLDGGFTWVLTLLLCTWASDTFAYLVGKKMGKRKIAPDLSPGKTVEGALGGFAGSLLAAVGVYLYSPLLPLNGFLALGFLIALAGLFGDLLESSFKRSAGIKDTGGIIPGHGGVLDRFDSLLLTAPVVFYFVILYTGEKVLAR